MPKIIVLFGVAGCGKTVVGQSLATRLGCCFHDADDYHSVENVEKMRNGIPLNDEDRLPWLLTLHKVICESSVDMVLACSALKRDYRSILVFGLTAPLAKTVLAQGPVTTPSPEFNGCHWARGSQGGHPWNWPIFFHLRGDKETIRDRMMKRSGHFISVRLIDSQFEALQEADDEERECLWPSTVRVVDVLKSVETIVEDVAAILAAS